MKYFKCCCWGSGHVPQNTALWCIEYFEQKELEKRAGAGRSLWPLLLLILFHLKQPSNPQLRCLYLEERSILLCKNKGTPRRILTNILLHFLQFITITSCFLIYISLWLHSSTNLAWNTQVQLFSKASFSYEGFHVGDYEETSRERVVLHEAGSQKPPLS